MGIISSLQMMIAGTLASSADVNQNFEVLRTTANLNTSNIANLTYCFFRQPSTTYRKNDVVYIPNSSLTLLCTVGGTTSSDDIVYTNIVDRSSVVDGTVTWLAGYRSSIVGSAFTSGSALPLGAVIPACCLIDDSDSAYRLLNGQSIRQIDYPDFYALIIKKSDEKKIGECNAVEYQNNISNFKQCAKFVIDRNAQTIKLPTITRFIAGITSPSEIGNTYQDQIVNITGYSWSNTSANCSGVFRQSSSGEWGGGKSDTPSAGYQSFDASRVCNVGDEVQPRHSKYPYYIVVSQTSRKGLDGVNGINGFSPLIEVKTDENSCYLEITDSVGSHTTSNLKAHTPIKGVDYFTSDDVTQISEQIKVESILLSQKIVSSAIALEKNVTVYKLIPTDGVSLSFDVSNLDLSENAVITFELFVSMSETSYSIVFPSSVHWLEENIDYSDVGNYLFVFRSFDGGSTWLGNLQGVW